MIFLTGSTGFVGKSVLKYFGSENIVQLSRDVEYNFDSASCVIHLAGKSNDLKNKSFSNEYYQSNTELTKKVFDTFLISSARIFITLSSVKAVADKITGELTEEFQPDPISHYGKSKLYAERYILSKEVPSWKKVYVLRPCMIHGPGNKGNLNLLYQFVSRNIPWPLGDFENKRSLCSIDNLMFVFKELIEREDIPSGIYNVSDDEPLSTNELVTLMAQSLKRKPRILKISKPLIENLSLLGDKLHLPLNSDRLQKLADTYVVSNNKIKAAIGKSFPISSREGLLKTFKSFKIDDSNI